MDTDLQDVPPPATDSQLLGRCLLGDRAAFARLAGRYRPLARAVAFGESGDAELAEDAAQEALAIAWEKLPELRDPACFRSWLCGIVRNVLRGRRRRWRRHAPEVGARPEPGGAAQAAELAAGGPSPLERLIHRQRLGAVARELARLPERYRAPLLLFYGEQLRVREVAELLGLSEEVVRQRLARGRRRLKDRVPRERLAAVPLLAGSELLPAGSGAPVAGLGVGLGGFAKAAILACGAALAVAVLAPALSGASGARAAGGEPVQVGPLALERAPALVLARGAPEPRLEVEETAAERSGAPAGGTGEVEVRPAAPASPQRSPERPVKEMRFRHGPAVLAPSPQPSPVKEMRFRHGPAVLAPSPPRRQPSLRRPAAEPSAPAFEPLAFEPPGPKTIPDL